MASINAEEIFYTFYLVDNVGNIRRYSVSYGSGMPYLKGFNKSNTFYVTYDENGNETSSIPIGETAPSNWYDYDNQMWANIVVRDNGNENYYTWIPRYMYTLDNDNQKVNAVFVDLDNKDIETGKSLNNTEYKLPEAFTWVNPDDPNDVVQLTGFWASKYKLRDGSTTIPDISGGSGVIRVNNISEATNSSYTCEMYLIKDGKRIAWDDATNAYIENTNSMQLTGNYIYKNVEPGTYTVSIIVKDASTGLQVKGIANEVIVAESSDPNKPDTSSFTKSNTFYVAYDENGNEDSSIPIGEAAPANWYDYDSSNWANIVVRENGNENYYTWIPRYEYKLNASLEKTNVLFIPTTQTVADSGYQIPEAFTWSDGNTTTQLSGFWASKYKLRDGATYDPDIYGLGGKVCIDGVVAHFGSGYTYEAYVIDENGKFAIDTNGNVAKKTITGDAKITKLVEGDYTVNVIVKDSTGKHIQGVSKDVTVLPQTPVNTPDLSMYNENVTFYVTYDSNGSEISNKPINEAEPSDWYDYDDDKNAVIVVRENGFETYYEWIPRYQCSTSDSTHISYITTDKTTPDTGYTIPSAFTDEDGNALSGYWNKIDTKTNRITANVTSNENEIIVTNITLPSGTSKAYICLIQNGKIIKAEEELTGNSYTYTGLTKDAYYAMNIIAYDANGIMVGGYTEEEMLFDIIVDLTGFNPNNTFYVVYDANGNEDSTIPIGEAEPTNWYNYENQQWANIVVRDNGNVNYYTWIPRYEYKLNETSQKANVRFIPVSQEIASDGYQIPEAFTWSDGNTTTQLAGFWASKYKLRDTTTDVPDISGGSGVARVKNISEATNSSYVCDMYLIKDGKRIVWDASQNKYVEGTKAITLTGDYTFKKLDPGTYAVNIIVKDASTNLQVKAITNEVVVSESSEPNEPDISSFSKSNTFYVVYDENGNEDSSIPIGEATPTNWYDYDSSNWANVVVREDGNENYYTWIPRYEYKLNESLQKTNILFIKETQTVADSGYKIPEAFTWVDPDNPDNVVQLSGFWASKYKLREGSTYDPDIYGLGGKICIDGVVAQFGSDYTYEAYVIKEDGTIYTHKAITGDDKFTGIPEGNYTVNIIVKDGDKHIQGIAKDVEVLEKTPANKPDYSSYNINTTCFVTYNSTLGVESGSNIPIGSNEPDGWYDYDEDKKATIVTRENGIETYYEWIPRYQASTSNSNHISYIDIHQTTADAGYTIPSEFTDASGNAISGYWKEIASYTNRMTANIAAGENKIVISSISATTSTVYLVKDGVVIDTQAVIGSTHTFNVSVEGKYGVHIISSNVNGTTNASVAQEVIVAKLDVPDLTGFMVDTTYIVVYDSEGNESQIKLSTVLENDATTENGALKTGKVDVSKISGTWYDYAEQKWANIVTINDGYTNYFTWIPRYEYSLNTDAQKTIVRFIPTSQETASEGYQIPEAFTWNDGTTTRQLSGFWASKYKLRQ